MRWAPQRLTQRAPASCPPGNKCRDDPRWLRCLHKSLTASSVPPLIALATTRARGTKGADDGWIALLLGVCNAGIPCRSGRARFCGLRPGWPRRCVCSSPRLPPSPSRCRPHAAQQPGRTITIVVPFTPGTGPDILARVMGEEIQRRWGQPVVIENKPGASGNIGTQVAARVGAGRPHLASDHLALHPERLAVQERALRSRWLTSRPSSTSSTAFMALAVHPSVPATSAQAFVDYLKARPGRAQLRFARARHAAPPLHGAVQAGHGHGPEARPLSRVGARRAGPGRRPCQRDVHPRACRPAAGEGQPDPFLGASPTSSASASRPTCPRFPSRASRASTSISGWGCWRPREPRPRRLPATTASSMRSCARRRSPASCRRRASSPSAGRRADFAALIARDLAKWRKVVKDAGIAPE